MKKKDIRPGGRYLIPVVVSETTDADEGLNMIRTVTEDDGEVVYVHPETMIPAEADEDKTDHAFLSASAAERWINCPGSARLAALYPEEHSDAAEEGSLAHSLAQVLIQSLVGDITVKKAANELGRLQKKIDAFYASHKGLAGSFDAMKKILEPYIDYVWAKYQEAKKTDEAAVLMTERRVSFTEYVPEGFGTSDVVIIGGGKATVIDLKYGKGVPVSAVNNPQIRLYAIGAIAEFDLIYDFDRMEVVIYQPRLDSVTSQELTVEELKAWAENVVKPAAAEAASEGAHFNPDGPWCDTHFCPAAAKCKARAKRLLDLERYAVQDPELLTDDELGEILPRLDALQSFARKVSDYALGAISTGHPIKGWKVIEGRSNRKYKDEDKVAAAVKAAGYDEALLYERSLLGITKMTSLLGAKQFKEIIEKAGLIYKPPGSPKLAPESDPHPAFNPAAADFDD